MIGNCFSPLLRGALALLICFSTAPAWAASNTINADGINAYRVYNTPGIPASGNHTPGKADITALFNEIQNAFTTIGVYLADFNPDPSYATDSTTAFQNFWTACKASQTGAYGGAGGHNCIMPPGRFKLTSSLYWDFAGNIAGGLMMTGAGQNATILDFHSVSGANLTIGCSTGTSSAECSVFYPVFNNFGVVTNAPSGAAMQVGQHGTAVNNFTDAMNGFGFYNIWAKNIAGNNNGPGLELNQVFSSVFINVTTSGGCSDPTGANCTGAGDSLSIRQSSFNFFQGSFSGAKCGIRFTLGYSFGNVFVANDLEVNHIDLCLDSPYGSYNTFIGGQYVWDSTGNAVEASGGNSNVVDNPNFSGSIGGSNPSVPSSITGVRVENGPVTLNIATPTLVSNSILTNNTGRLVMVIAYNLAAGDYLCWGLLAGSCVSNNVTGGGISEMLPVGYQVKLHSAAGSWQGQEVP